MIRCNGKEKIRKHYDLVSHYYQTLWGEPVHHGYWIRGDETKKRAQIHLIEHLAQVAGIRPGCRILDMMQAVPPFFSYLLGVSGGMRRLFGRRASTRINRNRPRPLHGKSAKFQRDTRQLSGRFCPRARFRGGFRNEKRH